MSKCDPKNLTTNIPPFGPGINIPGFGLSFAPNLDGYIKDLSDKFPYDLNDLLKKLTFKLPSGEIKQPYNLKIDQSVMDAIVKYLDKAYPFLMKYAFILPILELILCIIEVLCALPNPFKVIRAVRRLFRKCIPGFLSLFPVFALPILIISFLLLLLALIEYILQQLTRVLDLLKKNIKTIARAIQRNDPAVHKAALTKIAWLLCSFQNLFVVFATYKAIFDVIKGIILRLFSIPPCDDGDNGSSDCCTPDVCPAFLKNERIDSNTGTITRISDGNVQIFDKLIDYKKAFININNPYDLQYYKSFFPSGVTISKSTPLDDAPYTINVRFKYDPSVYGREDQDGARFIRVNNCIVLSEPSSFLTDYNKNTIKVDSGVLSIAGGLAYEDDGTTKFMLNDKHASIDEIIVNINNDPIFQPISSAASLNYDDVTYSLNINHGALCLKYQLITIGCIPSVALDKEIANLPFKNPGFKVREVEDIINNNFPDFDRVITEIDVAFTALRSNVSEEGVDTFKSAIEASLNKLKEDAQLSIEKLIKISSDMYKSDFYIDTDIQFTTKPIKLTVDLIDSNGQSLCSNLPSEIGDNISKEISGLISFGQISNFQYDGSRYFHADITSSESGSGDVKVSVNNQILSSLNIPANIDSEMLLSPKSLNYQFVFSAPVPADSIRRDLEDVSDTSTEDNG